ncbi:MAG: hypothetical protein RQ748_09940 [Elusimicrobiales bacterium]|nr:hypothetical protein [Elusimicrobiales bacterium]
MKLIQIPLFVLGFAGLAVSCASAAGEHAHKSGALAVMPVLYHMPDTKLGYGAMGGYFKRLSETAQASNVHGMFSYTELKQFNTLLMAEYYPANKKTYFMGYVQYLHFPDEFYGIGNKAGELEKYTADITILELNPAYKLSPLLRIGPKLYYRKEKLPVTEEGKTLAQGAVPGAGGLNELGLGLTVVSDGRDDVLFSRKGHYFEASYLTFNRPFTRDYEYGVLRLDLRKFFSLPGGSVLALQGAGEFGRGEIPFQMLPRLGDILRGYKKARYRDHNMLAVQGEYKFGLVKSVMGVLFAGAGNVYHKFGRIELSNAKLAGGAGLRVRLSKKEEINLRLDYGKNSDGGGELYFMVMEAF